MTTELEPATDEELAQWEAEWTAEADKRNEHDLSIDHLTERKAISIAKKVKTYLHDNHRMIDGGGCKLFSDTFTYVTGGGDRGFTTHETGAVLALVMDGGGFYDFFSPNGDGAYYGCDDGYKLEQFIESMGYRAEWITSYCLGVYEQ
tara:strand:+ start:334 stop:774 length:441 start_codon:yes stop_codon:yes gene_type:complete